MIKFVESKDMTLTDLFIRHLDDMFAFSCGVTGTMLAITSDNPIIVWFATPLGQIAKFVIVSIGGGFLGMAGKKLLELFLTLCESAWFYFRDKMRKRFKR